MGLFQNAVDTYDYMTDFVGIPDETRAAALAPVGHMTKKANIEITIDDKGGFIQAKKWDEEILFPATEQSSGRTSNIVAHPLCDQLGYVTPVEPNKHELYIRQLRDWCHSAFSHPKARAVLLYEESGTIMQDLSSAGLLKISVSGKLENEKDFVCWRVISADEGKTGVWEDLSLIKSFQDYYQTLQREKKKEISMISGRLEPVTTQHLKGIVPINGNAKLISANDKTYYTYRGRFLDENEALSVGYEDSQKAHNALKWLLSNDGVRLGGGRELICWNPKGKSVPKPNSSLSKRSEEKATPLAYKEALQKIILGYKREYDFSDITAVAIFDAATSGRLSVAYYSEFDASDFVERLRYWDETCCWYDNRWGTASPSLYDIISFAFGVNNKGRMEVDDKIQAQQLQRLVSCKIDRIRFPLDIMRLLVEKSSNMQIYEGNLRNNLLFVACAAIRKYRIDYFKEVWEMALEPQKQDRSYQYGRLLAVMEKIERDTYDKDEKREPNAIRLQAVYVKRPEYAAGMLMNQLKTAYYPQLKPDTRICYERLIGQIMEIISECSDDANKPLGESYLLGYYLQKNKLYEKKETDVK